MVVDGGERSNAALAGTIETESSQVGRSAYRKCHGVDNPKRRGKAPPFWSLGVQGRDRNAPAVLLGDSKGAFSHVREGPLCLRTLRHAGNKPQRTALLFHPNLHKKLQSCKPLRIYGLTMEPRHVMIAPVL